MPMIFWNSWIDVWKGSSDLSALLWYNIRTQRAHDVKMTSSWHIYDVTTSHTCQYDVVTTSYACLEDLTRTSYLRHWYSFLTRGWCDLGSARAQLDQSLNFMLMIFWNSWIDVCKGSSDLSALLWYNIRTQRAHDVKMTSSWHIYDVTTSHTCQYDVVTTSYACLED